MRSSRHRNIKTIFDKLKKAIKDISDDDYYIGLEMENTPPLLKTYLASDTSRRYITNELAITRYNSKLGIFIEKLDLYCNTIELFDYIDKYVTYKRHIINFSYQSGIAIKYQRWQATPKSVEEYIPEFWLIFNVSANIISVEIAGEYDSVLKIKSHLLQFFKKVESTIEWVYSNQGDTVTLSLNSDDFPITEMYPFLNGVQLNDYFDEYLNSKASVLLLIGPPGTGKTSFIKGLLHHCESDSMVTYDPSVMEKDYMFAQFMESDTKFLIIEDADSFLRSRENGSLMMHKFLNISSGLISNKNKKLVFSTNLPNITDIDDALLRPGRCFDVLEFRNLNNKEANTIREKYNLPLVQMDSESVTLANVFNTGSSVSKSKNVFKPTKLGFY